LTILLLLELEQFFSGFSRISLLCWTEDFYWILLGFTGFFSSQIKNKKKQTYGQVCGVALRQHHGDGPRKVELVRQRHHFPLMNSSFKKNRML